MANSIDDFKIGEIVKSGNLEYKVVDIDRKKGKVICKVIGQQQFEYRPDEVKKVTSAYSVKN